MMLDAMTESPDRKRPQSVTFTVDGEAVTTTEKELTPNEILKLAGVDPGTHYLVEIKDHHRESYQGRGDEQIRVHEGDMFVSLSTGPTPTS